MRGSHGPKAHAFLGVKATRTSLDGLHGGSPRKCSAGSAVYIHPFVSLLRTGCSAEFIIGDPALLVPHAVAASANIQAMHFVRAGIEEIVNQREAVAPGAAWLLPITSVRASLLVFPHLS